MGSNGRRWADPTGAEVHAPRPLLIGGARPRLWRGMHHDPVVPQPVRDRIVIAQGERGQRVGAGSLGSEGVVGIRARHPEQCLRLAIVWLQVIVGQWPIVTVAIQGARFEVLGQHSQCDGLPNGGASAHHHDAFRIEIVLIAARACQMLQILGKAVGRVVIQIEDLLAKLATMWVRVFRTLFEDLHINPFIGQVVGHGRPDNARPNNCHGTFGHKSLFGVR